MSIQVGDEVQDVDGDICTVLAVAGEEAAILHRDRGICARWVRDLAPYVPPAPEPPLTGEQAAYVLELVEQCLRSADPSYSNIVHYDKTMRALSDRAERLRK